MKLVIVGYRLQLDNSRHEVAGALIPFLIARGNVGSIPTTVNLQLKEIKMNTYCPDKWIVVELKEHKISKILSGYSGGYLYGNSWRLSSGITKIIDKDSILEIHNESGSIYHCHKNSFGVNMESSGILKEIQEFTAVVLPTIEDLMLLAEVQDANN